MIDQNSMDYLKGLILQLVHNSNEDAETVVERARVYLKFVTEKDSA